MDVTTRKKIWAVGLSFAGMPDMIYTPPMTLAKAMELAIRLNKVPGLVASVCPAWAAQHGAARADGLAVDGVSAAAARR